MSLFLVLFDFVFAAVSSLSVGFTMGCFMTFTVGGVAVLLVELPGFFPLVTFAGSRNKEQPGGSGGEKRGQFHPGAGVANRPPMASELSRQYVEIRPPRRPSSAGGIDNETDEINENKGIGSSFRGPHRVQIPARL